LEKNSILDVMLAVLLSVPTTVVLAPLMAEVNTGRIQQDESLEV